MTPAHTAVTGAALPPALEPFAAAPARSALFLDFDGTMAAIVADPRDARPLPGVPALLGELADEFALVAVISGRPTSFLAEALGPPAGVTLAGLYGLERAAGRPRVRRLGFGHRPGGGRGRGGRAGGCVRRAQGVDRHAALAPRPAAARLGASASRSGPPPRTGLLVHEGRHERELRPPLAVDKGTVVRSLAAEMAGRLDNAAAFGDDVGDLPTFAALGELTGAGGRPLHTVRVAAVDTESPRQVAEQADITVAGAPGAVELLRALADAAAAARPQA